VKVRRSIKRPVARPKPPVTTKKPKPITTPRAQPVSVWDPRPPAQAWWP
jgi:hypothetical protein